MSSYQRPAVQDCARCAPSPITKGSLSYLSSLDPFLEEDLGRNAKQYTLYHITGHRYYYEYEDNHGFPWEWDCSWPKHVRRGISGLMRGHVRDVSVYDPACYLPVYKLLQFAKSKFPDYADRINLFELISMAIYDEKDRVEFLCGYDSNINEELELWAAPVKVRCGQGHTDDVLETRGRSHFSWLFPRQPQRLCARPRHP